MSLVNQAAVHIPVAQHGYSPVNGGQHLLRQMLSAGRGIQKRLCSAVHGGMLLVQDNGADFLSDPDPSRLPGYHNLHSLLPQKCFNLRNQGGFARPFSAFHCNKPTFRHFTTPFAV
ncbi:hypothetical protein D3C76_1357690 [compost metagenome]